MSATVTSSDYLGLGWTTPEPQPKPQDAAYWPLWLNIAAPLLGTVVFALVQAMLLYIDDPGLRRAKRNKLAGSGGGDAHVEAAAATNVAGSDVEKAAAAAAAAVNGQASATMATADAGVQCEIIKPADHLQQHPGANRRRTSSAGSVPESDTMRLLEGMLLRPRRPLSRRRLSESEQGAVDSTDGINPAAGAAHSSSTGGPGVSATQSLTGPGAKRFAAGLQHRLLAAKRSQQQGGRKGSGSEA